MGTLERLYYFASSEISQAPLRCPWNCRAIWHTHMILCIKHMPQKSMVARRGNQGNHIHPRITVKMGILEILYYYASSEISQALLKPMKLYIHMAHSHDTLYQANAPEKYGCKTWKSGKSHLSSDQCENGHSREMVLLCIVRNLASPSKTPMEL